MRSPVKNQPLKMNGNYRHVEKSANNPDPLGTMGFAATTLGGGAAAGAVLMSLLRRLESRPKPYDPKKIVKRLQDTTRIRPGSGHDLDIVYPVLKQSSTKSAFLGKAYQNYTDSMTSGVGNMLIGTLGLPLSIYAGMRGTDKIHDLIRRRTPANYTRDRKYIEDELSKAKEKYRKTLLSAQLEREVEDNPKLASALDRLEKEAEKSASAHTEKKAWFWPLLGIGGLGAGILGTKYLGNKIDAGVQSLTPSAPSDTAKNVATVGLAAAGLMAPFAAYHSRKYDLESQHPIRDVPDVDDSVRKAILLRSRALAAGRGLPPIHVRTKPVEIRSDLPGPINDEDEAKRKKQIEEASAKAAAFVERMF